MSMSVRMPSSLFLVSLEGLPYRIGHQYVRLPCLLNLSVKPKTLCFSYDVQVL